MQYHASSITADGAYHCPVGSIRPFFLPLLHQHCLVDVNFTFAYFHFCPPSRVHATFLFLNIFLHLFLLFILQLLHFFARPRVLVNATFFLSPNFQYRTLSGSTGVSNLCKHQFYRILCPFSPLFNFPFVSFLQKSRRLLQQAAVSEQKSILIRNHMLKSIE